MIVVGTILEVRGLRWIVIDLFELGFTRPGRPPTSREMAAARVPYQAPDFRVPPTSPEVPDDALSEREAIRQAMIEQRRQPPDLVNVAA